jgi:hypothetical protein
MTKVLVLVTGTGRSGTSTMAGSLHHLGLNVPGPLLGANKSNPKGFFESRWAVRFHKRIAAAAGLDDFDSRPNALELAQKAVTPRLRGQLTAYVERVTAEHDQVVVKDPRSVWAQRLWREVCADVGVDIGYVSMLRHPAEVVGSRTTYYASANDAQARLRYQTTSVARWVNSSLITERETRGQRRAFVLYADLLTDWRSVFRPLAAGLGLRLEGDLESGSHHPVDDFIEPDLRRHQASWADIDIPVALRALAESVWGAAVRLSGDGLGAPDGTADFEQLSERYTRLFGEAAAISRDAIAGARLEGRRAALAEARDAGKGEDDRRLSDASGRELLQAAGARALRRVRRT